MWTLECDGDSLAHKKIWLRPGKKYLFGRTKEPKGRNAGFKIDHKSVSRQHLTLSVSTVKPGEGSRVNIRSEITLKDEDTKFLTEIDGSKVKNDTRILKRDEHVFRLGNSDQTFHIKWQPVVFTFSLSSKEMKDGKDPLANYRARLEGLDIKVVIPYVIGATTHVVAGKRNTAKGLQALVNGKYIVSETFIDALVYATTPTDLNEEESFSPLEEDFENNWPDALQHLPAKSKEPSERPSTDFEPNPQRGNVFEGYTFVFCDSIQFSALHDPISNGGGKALQYELDSGKTSAEDIVRFVKNAAGEKGLGEFEDGSEGKGVVLVKFRGKKEYANWAADLDFRVAQALDHRLIEQSEFLEAILTNDASMLRRPLLAEEDEAPAITSPAPPLQTAAEIDTATPPKTSRPPPRRARPRRAIVSRFKGFDDDDDNSNPVASRPTPMELHEDSMPKGKQPRRYSRGISFAAGDAMDVDSTSQINGDSEAANGRKRPAPSSEVDDEEELVDKLLPAATAMKRRRIEEEAEADRNSVSETQSFGVSQPEVAPSKKTQPRKEINIKDVVRERREAEEAAARRDEETLRDTLEGMSVEEMKSLAVIEEMMLPERKEQHPRASAEHNSRWDERWNGRKNFKKFRRRGETAQSRRGQSVIVPLEEVKKKGFGIGEGYWGESEKSQRQRREKQTSVTQSQSQQRTSTSHTAARSQLVEVPSELAVNDGSSVPETIDKDAPRTTRHQERTQQADESSSRSQTVLGKRPAPSQAQPPGPEKRKKLAAAKDSDSDSEDELKFRFKKR